MAKAAALFDEGELADVPERLLTDAVAAYNAIAATVNATMKSIQWREAKVLTSARRKRLKVAVADYGGLRGFKAELEQAAKNDFLIGKEGRTGNHSGWKPDLDFFCQPKTITKILEGAWAPSEPVGKKLFIPTPYQPPHLKPAEPFVPEDPDVRDAALIVSWRKVGKWDRANAVEERMAKRQGRPPVLVPAPDVAGIGMPPKPETRPADNGRFAGKTAASGRVDRFSDQTLPAAVDIEWNDDIPEGAEHDADD